MRPFKPRARAAKTSMQMRHEGYGVRGGVSRTPPDRDSCLRGGWGEGSAAPQYSRGGVGTRVRGGPRAAEEGAKRHSSGGDRCLGVRVSLIMLVWNSENPFCFEFIGSVGPAHAVGLPPHGVEKRMRIWIGPNISNTVPLGQSSSTWRVCGPPRSGRASSSRPRSRTRTRATRRRHTTRTNLTNSPIHYIKVVPRTTVSRLPYPMLGVAARSRDPTIS